MEFVVLWISKFLVFGAFTFRMRLSNRQSIPFPSHSGYALTSLCNWVFIEMWAKKFGAAIQWIRCWLWMVALIILAWPFTIGISWHKIVVRITKFFGCNLSLQIYLSPIKRQHHVKWLVIWKGKTVAGKEMAMRIKNSNNDFGQFANGLNLS